MSNQLSSKYVEEQRKLYSLYVLSSRAIPSVIDGLKISGRRVLWMARDGKLHKSASLAGLTMPIHPHAAPEGAINTLSAPYCNNIPLFDGEGAFGTLLKPTAYGASRYTSVKVSQFTKDVIFKDIEIIPMVDNYDNTLLEPRHFLPLIPIVLLNPSEGIAVGFATYILPRSLKQLIQAQIQYLQGKRIAGKLAPTFTPTKTTATCIEQNTFKFFGELEKVNSTTVKITKLPYGLLHKKYVACLNQLIETGKIQSYEDNSNNQYDICVKFTREELSKYNEQQLIEVLGLTTKHNENLTVTNFDCNTIWQPNPITLIKEFTDISTKNLKQAVDGESVRLVGC